MQPSPLTFRLTRVGSPASTPNSLQLFLRLQTAAEEAAQTKLMRDKNDPADFSAQVEEQRLEAPRHVMWALSGVIPIGARTFGKHTKETLATAYGQMLERVAKGTSSGLSLAKILAALDHGLPGAYEGCRGGVGAGGLGDSGTADFPRRPHPLRLRVRELRRFQSGQQLDLFDVDHDGEEIA